MIARVLRYLLIGMICFSALLAAGYYMFDPRFAKSASPAKSAGHGEEKGGHDEGVKLTDAQVTAAGIELLKAGPRYLQDVLLLNGSISPNQ